MESTHKKQDDGTPTHQFNVLERDGSDGKSPAKELPLETLRNIRPRIEINASDRTELLREAQEKLNRNDDLFKRFLSAVEAKEERIVTELASIENYFLRYCVNLSSDEIRSLTTNFERDFIAWTHRVPNLIITPFASKKIFDRSVFPRAEGIISVVNYIKARKILLGSKPAQKIDFYLNNTLDAHWKIDLIEVLYTEGLEPKVREMNLVQVKTSNPTEEELSSITQDHTVWLDSVMFDLDSLEKFYVDKREGKEHINAFYAKMREIDEIFLDICTSPSLTTEEILLKRLNLEDLNDKTRLWLVWKYVPLLLERLDGAREIGAVDEAGYFDIKALLNALYDRLVKSSKIPKNMIPVEDVSSIIAVGREIVKNTRLKAGGKLVSYR